MASGGELRAVPRNRERTAIDFLLETPYFPAALPVPKPNRTVAGARGQRLFVRKKHQRCNRFLVTAKYAATSVMAEPPQVIPFKRAQVLVPGPRTHFFQDLHGP